MCTGNVYLERGLGFWGEREGLTVPQYTGECGLGFWRAFDWSNRLWSLRSGTFQGKPSLQSSPHLILIDNLLYLLRSQAKKNKIKEILSLKVRMLVNL